ncbi:UNVERIFIED_CONTAM: hypothetical protein Sindi_2895800 [Sesamum indicum]
MNSQIALRLRALRNNSNTDAPPVASVVENSPTPMQACNPPDPIVPVPINISEDTLARPTANEIPHLSIFGSATSDSSPEGVPTRNKATRAGPSGSKNRKRKHKDHSGGSQSTKSSKESKSRAKSRLVKEWKEARTELKSDQHLSAELEGNKLVPDWKISSRSSILERVVTLLKTPQTRFEEHHAHVIMQAVAFNCNHSLKCTGYHQAQMIAGRKVRDLRKKLADSNAREKELEAKGINEGREGYISLDKNQNLLVASRLQAARDFLKAPAFPVVVEIKAANFINDGFEKCKAQVATLRGFGDGFDQSHLDPSLVGNLQPYPEEKAPANRKMNFLPY